MAVFGEQFGISIEIVDGKLTLLKDGAFKKAVPLSENFSSVRRVELSNETFISTSLDPHDPLLDTTNVMVRPSTGTQKKVFSQNMEMGVRKIEVVQGAEVGQAIVRVSYSVERAMKWQLHIPYERGGGAGQIGAGHTIELPQNIKMTIQTDELVKYDDDVLIFSIQQGFSQIVLFINSEVPYETIGKNLLLLTYGDESKQDILSMAPADTNFFPIITFVYVQDFKSNLTRFQDLYQIGSLLAQKKRNKEAITYLKKALETVRTVGDQNMEAEILMSLATVESDAGDYKQAANDFNYALKIVEEYENESLRAGCLLSLSKNLKKLNKHQEALDNQYMILETVRANQDRLGEAEILVDICDSLMGLGHIDEAIEYQQAALQLRRQMGDEIGEANDLMRFGELLITSDRTGEAMSCYEQALRIKRNLSDDRGVAECLKNMGIAFFNRGKYEKAKVYYEKAKEAFQNQALLLEVKEIDKLLDKMKEHPYPEGGCDICKSSCTPSIVGLAHTEAVRDTFLGPFKQALRESLAIKNMDKMVDLLSEIAAYIPDLQSHGVTSDGFAFCLMVQATHLHLEQLSGEQKEQIIKMVQENIKIRRYRQM